MDEREFAVWNRLDTVKKIDEDYELSDGQICAWRNCYQVLTKSFSSLPEAYGNLWVVFEYVLPQHAPGTNRFIDEKHIRSDVILVSRDVAMVLEFKQSAEAFDGYYRQANKYRRRLKRFHEESDGMAIEAVLVLSRAEDYTGALGDVNLYWLQSIPEQRQKPLMWHSALQQNKLGSAYRGTRSRR